MSDLVERLRRHNAKLMHSYPLIDEAADEIERLRAEVASEREAYNMLTALLKKRFPPRPDGTLPDYAIEDVLIENEQLRALPQMVATIFGEGEEG